MPKHCANVPANERALVLKHITIVALNGYWDEEGNAGRWHWGDKICYSRACLVCIKAGEPCVARYNPKTGKELKVCERCAKLKCPCGAAGKGE